MDLLYHHFIYGITIVCTGPHHDMEVDVFAGLFSGKERQVLRMLLGWVVQNGPRIKTSLRNGHIVFDHCWISKKNYTSVWNHIRFYSICVKRLLWSMSFCWYLDKWQQQSLVNDITGAIRVNISLTLNIRWMCDQHIQESKPSVLSTGSRPSHIV